MSETSTLWEDTDLIEQWKKSESKPTFAPSDGINEINNVSVKNECDNIGNKKKWKRNCPKCNKEIFYSNKNYILQSIKLNRKCHKCALDEIARKKRNNLIGKKIKNFLITNQYTDKNKGYVDVICDCGCSYTHRLLANLKRITTNKCNHCAGQNRIGKISPNRLEPGEAGFNRIYKKYQSRAKERGLEFALSKETAKEIFTKNCFYCGIPPLQKSDWHKYKHGVFIYNGIDRKDNTKGYIIENCVPCCGYCNSVKREFSLKKFITWIRNVDENTKDLKF